MNKQSLVHCGKITKSQISPNSKGFCISYPGKVEPAYTGVTAREQKGADNWEACCYDYIHVHKEPAGLIKESQKNLKDGGKSIKVDKGAPQEKDGFSSSGLRGRSGGGIGPTNLLDLLLMSVQDENHGAASPECEPQT